MAELYKLSVISSLFKRVIFLKGRLVICVLISLELFCHTYKSLYLPILKFIPNPKLFFGIA